MKIPALASVPATLLVGSPEKISDTTISLLKSHFCSKASLDDCFCAQCRMITQRQHHGIVWISPEKDYTVDDVEPVFERTRFALDEGQHCFLILERADTMNTATANRLLKLLEEPPQGYHFVVLTSNANDILPTIRSRCVETIVHGDHTGSFGAYHGLLQYFLSEHHARSPFDFEALLKELHLSDTQSFDAVQILLGELTERWKGALRASEQSRAERINVQREFVVASLRKPPQSGSSDLFWKQFFIRYPW